MSRNGKGPTCSPHLSGLKTSSLLLLTVEEFPTEPWSLGGWGEELVVDHVFIYCFEVCGLLSWLTHSSDGRKKPSETTWRKFSFNNTAYFCGHGCAESYSISYLFTGVRAETAPRVNSVSRHFWNNAAPAPAHNEVVGHVFPNKRTSGLCLPAREEEILLYHKRAP